MPSDPSNNSYAYDSIFGNLDTRTKNSLNSRFTYDRYNLLSQITWPGDPTPQTTFVSDAAGNRLRMTTSTSVQYDFMYDTTAGIPAVLMEKTGTDPAKLYIRTPDGRLIAQAHIASGSPVLDHYYHFDGLGSTLALTDSSGNTTDTYTYDAWGKLTNHTGTTDQPYQFVGQLGYYTNYQDTKLDPESSDANKYVMLQLGVRYYAPEMGRFTQRDVVSNDETIPYLYAYGNPLSYLDPTGKTAWDCWTHPFPHRYVCINDECYGFYPDLMAPRPNIPPCEQLCFKGVVRREPSNYRPGASGTNCKKVKATKEQEDAMSDKILFDKANPDRYCLVPVPPLSQNCISWARGVFSAGR